MIFEPLQRSSAVAPPLLANHSAKALSIFSLHSISISAASTVIFGGVVSSIVNVAEVVLELPHWSVAVKVTITLPVSPQSSARLPASFVQVISLQLSVAIAPPLLAIQAASASAFPVPSHSTNSSCAAVEISGAVPSMIVIT